MVTATIGTIRGLALPRKVTPVCESRRASYGNTRENPKKVTG